MFKSRCPLCKKEYSNYEDYLSIVGNYMCLDCYESETTPNQHTQPITSAYNDDRCQKCGGFKIAPTYWNGTFEPTLCHCLAVPKQPITKWEEMLKQHYRKDIADETIKVVNSIEFHDQLQLTEEGICFIANGFKDLRKQDENELIKMLPKEYPTEQLRALGKLIESCIKGYYNK
jgi:hypothetical protein